MEPLFTMAVEVENYKAGFPYGELSNEFVLIGHRDDLHVVFFEKAHQALSLDKVGLNEEDACGCASLIYEHTTPVRLTLEIKRSRRYGHFYLAMAV
jgi:hypothetical protein